LRKLHNVELNDLCSSPNIAGVFKSRRISWAGHVARGYKGFWWKNLREKNHLEDSGVDGMIILRWIYRMKDVGYGLDPAGSI
jgi:hypothetical protein